MFEKSLFYIHAPKEIINFCQMFFFVEAIAAQWHKRMTVNATIVDSIPIRGNELFINIFISSLSQKGRSNVPALHAVTRKFGEKWETQC